MSDQKTHYDVLGLSEDTPTAVIPAAYRAQMKSLHPDTETGDAARAGAVNEAYEVLRNPASRSAYDRMLAEERSRSAREHKERHQEPESEGNWGNESDWTAAGDPPHKTAQARSHPTADFTAEDPSSLAGLNVFERERIDLRKMPWFVQDYEARARRKDNVGWHLIRRSARFWAGLLFSLLALGTIFPVVAELIAYSYGEVTPADLARDTAIYLLFFPGLALVAGLKRARRRRGTTRYIIYVVAAGTVAFIVSVSPAMAVGLVMSAWLALYVLTVELFRTSSTGLGGGGKPRLSKLDIQKYNIWGNAGGALAHSNGQFRKRDVNLGVQGEIMTGQLINALLKMPGSQALHGLVFPGSLRADVDHAVLRGNRLAIIDSKHWRGGDYYWLGQALMHAGPGENPLFLTSQFGNAVNAYAAQFPKLEVRGWMVLHSANGIEIRTNNQDAGAKPRLVTPEDFLKETGAWLHEAERTKVNLRTLSRLVFEYGKSY